MFKSESIDKFVHGPTYSIDVPLEYIPESIGRYIRHYGLDIDPDFQRDHVWSVDDQRKYLEYVFRGGKTGLDIYFNCPGWMGRFSENMVLVDGKQRLKAVSDFFDNEVSIFGGHFLSDCEENFLRKTRTDLKFHVNNLESKEEVLKWYLSINSTGISHTREELDKVRTLLNKEK